jgi:hypothetical protein
LLLELQEAGTATAQALLAPPVLLSRRVPSWIYPRSREFALSRTREVIVAPTVIAKAISAAAMTTVVALTSPDSVSRSREARNLVHKYWNCIF